MPTPLNDYPGTVFTTSMTHQLHCLVSVVSQGQTLRCSLPQLTLSYFADSNG